MSTFAGGILGINQIAVPQITTGDPATVTDATAKNPIGGKIRWNNTILRYVKHNTGTGTVAAVAGGPAYPKTLTPAATATTAPVFTVTPDQSDGLMGRMPCGVYLAFTTAPATNTFVWIQIGGVHLTVNAPGAANTGQNIVGSASDGQFDLVADGTATYNVVGKIIGASSSGLSPALLMNMDW